jgi:hypothetical protein
MWISKKSASSPTCPPTPAPSSSLPKASSTTAASPSSGASATSGSRAVSFLAAPPEPLPPPDQVRVGSQIRISGAPFYVTHLTPVRYIGFEGELPFVTTDRSGFLTADLRTHDARFATIDYSETPPLLFAGRFVSFDELRLSNLREFEGW